MSILRQVMKSSGFMVAGSLFQKVAGLLSTLILARILTPDDFGIVAFLALTVNFFNAIAITGTQQYLLSKSEVDENDLNTALSLDLLMKGTFWLLLLFFSENISLYFNMPEAQFALIVLSSVLIIKALKNLGFLMHQKELNYAVLFKLELTAKVVSVTTVILLGIYTESYWAIVIGDIVLATFVTVGSYLLHGHRPTLTLVNIKPQWNFSKWMFSKGIIGFSKANLDQMFVTKMFPTSTVGSFYMARDIALLPAFDLLNKAVAPLLPALAKSANEPDHFAYRVSFSLLFINLLAIPVGVFMYTYSSNIISILLGEKWLHIEPIFLSFIPLMYLSCLAPVLVHALVAKQKVKITFWTDVIALLMHVVPFLVITTITLSTVVTIRTTALIVSLTILAVALKQLCNLSITRVYLLSIPSMAASVLAAMASNAYGETNGSIFSFIISASIFGLIFLVSFSLIVVLFKKTTEYNDLAKLVKPIISKLPIPNRKNST
ncbi:oligosaccharide flippase family protein [Psychrosphaera algicola]|uniref:Oligosaccharide flippase family protein n=1 Tax=Psychrosphaera algicola TaxID=3023714 RepID=A0ABT5FG38_9GAMM|nr:oligosaccharide flippase family protein [Psychrosphaera sp. G1-22]MDC2890034.1 oligosaccharide flippase family protein [Psychrosphaera sp. G1-22]